MSIPKYVQCRLILEDLSESTDTVCCQIVLRMQFDYLLRFSNASEGEGDHVSKAQQIAKEVVSLRYARNL